MAEVKRLKELDEHERTTYPLWLLEMHDKIDELVDAYNSHYHETLDTHYNTSSPREG